MIKYIIVLMTAILGGCASMRPVDVAKPSEVTVQAAMQDVAQGLLAFRQLAADKKTNFGLLVDEVTLTLKVTASAKDSSKLVVNVSDVKPAILAPAVLGGNYTLEGSSDATRDNTITVKLKNVYTAQLNAKGLATPIKPKPDGRADMGGIELLSRPYEVENCEKPKNALEKIICDARVKK